MKTARLLATFLVLVLAMVGSGCGPIVDLQCADPNARPVFTRDHAGRLTYEGCRVEIRDGSADGDAP